MVIHIDDLPPPVPNRTLVSHIIINLGDGTQSILQKINSDGERTNIIVRIEFDEGRYLYPSGTIIYLGDLVFIRLTITIRPTSPEIGGEMIPRTMEGYASLLANAIRGKIPAYIDVQVV